VDALILTHEHMDAFGGLDDVRGMQARSADGLAPMPVYLNHCTFNVVKKTFPYLIPKPVDPNAEVRMVAALDFINIKPFSPFSPAPNLSITPLPLVHGEDCVCLGFAFGSAQSVLYLSDLSRMPDDTAAYITEAGLKKRPEVLVIDALHMKYEHNTHLSLAGAAKLIREIHPKKAFLVGMGCDSFPPHHEANIMLKEMFKDDGIDVQLARDGLTVAVDL